MTFSIGDKVKHKDIKNKIGTVLHKVPESDYYYVRLNCTTYSIPWWSLQLVQSVSPDRVVGAGV